MQYPVNEVFETLQGEATHAGRPAIFIRLQGCPVGCAWCDTKHTWEVKPEDEVSVLVMSHKTGEGAEWAKVTPDSFIANIQTFRARHVVITGGEPALYDLRPLTDALHVAGYKTQVETSGTHALSVSDETWVTVSPKINMPGKFRVLPSVMKRANEIKHPVAIERNVDELLAFLDECGFDKAGSVPVWLQPIWQAPKSRAICYEACMTHGFRMSVQTHKVLGLR